jgi:hypothetical protein
MRQYYSVVINDSFSKTPFVELQMGCKAVFLQMEIQISIKKENIFKKISVKSLRNNHGMIEQ